ncbi:transglycosylase SLT domain-containing protein [Kitasatospora sp. NPDC058965]|uniref:aggregation-promoting factor C-terminal-like domain-containing protein n=1 Tax=Kitasatospora sp. NPDC058965 TaxID=3346682 RepID=UPI003684EB15
MRSALMTTARHRSSVVLASVGLAATCAASAVAFALPSDAATVAGGTAAAAPVATTQGAELKLSHNGSPNGGAPAVAAGDTGRIESAPYLKGTAKGDAGHTVTTAPYGAPAQAEPATPAAQPAAAQPQAPQQAPAPQPAAQPAPQQNDQPASRSEDRPALAAAPVATDTSPSGVRALAQSMVPAGQWNSFANIVSHESSWNLTATNPSSGSYGLGQALPASKMASAGSDWRTNPVTQIKWTLNYMNERYGSPNAAWVFWQNHHWY